MPPELSLRDPFWLVALAAVPVLAWLRRARTARVLAVPFSSAWHKDRTAEPIWWPWIAVVGGTILLIVGLARPQRSHREVLPPADGCDIMLAVDVSGSMASEDFKINGRPVNRLEVLTPLVEAFMTKRPNDRIGLVVFSGRAYTLSPPTFNHRWLSRQMDRLRVGMIEEGTAIGDAVAVCVRRLESANRRAAGQRAGAFVVLMTDGASNSGVIDPLQAAKMAQERGIPVYAIATGTHGLVRLPVVEADGRKRVAVQESDFDDVTLWKIAHQTGGKFFRAEWPDTIDAAFNAIDAGQKTAFEPRSVLITDELYPWLIVPGLALVVLGAAAVRLPWHRWVSA